MGRKLCHFPSALYLLFFSIRLAVSQSTVRYLPGFDGPLPFHLETGYIGVGKFEEDQLFYYFLESQKNPKEDPLVLWLTGGPACSGLSALLFEIGPLQFQKALFNGSIPKLVVRSYSWTNISSIIFIDSPVRTGFSYSEGSKVDDETGDIKTSQELHEFLRKWLIGHPQYRLNPVYIGGDSYGGKFAPIVALEIANGNEAEQEPVINLKGYVIGNPISDEKYEKGYVVPFAHGMGLISDELYESARKNCKGDYYTNKDKPNCARDLEAAERLISGVNANHILEPKCPRTSPKPKGNGGARRSLVNSRELSLPYPLPSLYCREYGVLLSYYWADFVSVRKALHIRPGTIGEWERCNMHLNYIKDVQGTIEYHLNLTTKGYRALVYSGDHDLTAPFVGTQALIRSLNFSVTGDWRPWTTDGQVAGFTRTYSNNLTFATVKGAGHTAPEYMPKECFAMFQRWISHKPL